MVQAKLSIAASPSRRNFIKSGAAVIAALTVPALANAAPSIEAEIANVIAEFETYGYSVTEIMHGDKPVGLLMRHPMTPRQWDAEGLQAAHSKYLKFQHDHRPELVDYLIKTGRTEPAVMPRQA